MRDHASYGPKCVLLDLVTNQLSKSSHRVVVVQPFEDYQYVKDYTSSLIHFRCSSSAMLPSTKLKHKSITTTFDFTMSSIM